MIYSHLIKTDCVCYQLRTLSTGMVLPLAQLSILAGRQHDRARLGAANDSVHSAQERLCAGVESTASNPSPRNDKPSTSTNMAKPG